MDLSIVVPVYNEEENVHYLYEQLTSVLDPLGLEYEIICADDGSTDHSFELLEELAQRDHRLKVIRFRRNYGQTAGFSAGFDHAIGDIVVTIDADLQNDPATSRPCSTRWLRVMTSFRVGAKTDRMPWSAASCPRGSPTGSSPKRRACTCTTVAVHCVRIG